MKNLGNDIAVDQKRPERAAATSPRQRLGGRWEQTNALQGQKLLHLQRVLPHTALTQGVALGYERVGPSGRFDNILNSRLKLLCNLRNPCLKPLKLTN